MDYLPHINDGTLTNLHNEWIYVGNGRVSDRTLSSCRGQYRQAQGLQRFS